MRDPSFALSIQRQQQRSDLRVDQRINRSMDLIDYNKIRNQKSGTLQLRGYFSNIDSSTAFATFGVPGGGNRAGS